MPTVNQPGKCPFCGSTNVMYGNYEFDTYHLTYEIVCKDCKKTSKEIYKTDFVGTVGNEEEFSSGATE